MNRLATIAAISLAVTYAAGCIPEKRIVWSPDGQRAAVASDNGLYFIDARGNVLQPRWTQSAAKCVWLPDGKSLVVFHTEKAKTWDEVRGLLDQNALKQVEAGAKDLKDRVLAYDGNWDDFKIDTHNLIRSSTEVALLLYVRDRMSEGLPEKLGEKWNDLQKVTADVTVVQSAKLTKTELTPGRVLLQTLDHTAFARVSPDGRNLALLMSASDSDDDAVVLCVMPLTGGAPRSVSADVAYNYDWSSDGRSLAFIRSTTRQCGGSEAQLGVLTTVTVADANGKLLQKWEEPVDRAGLLFNESLSVRWLSDGRLMFTSAEVTLPATVCDMPRQWSLFVIDPRTPASVTRVLGRNFDEPLEPSLPLFELSPDETRVLLLGPKGSLTLYAFASGESTAIAPLEADQDGELKSLPCWRNNAEFCFVAKAMGEGDAEQQNEVWLWKSGKKLAVSREWPEELREGWLDK
jgi:hypothetical protein